MEVIRPFVMLAPITHFDIKICKFVEHLEMSEGFEKYNNFYLVIFNVPLHLLVDCLFKNSRISIGHKHHINILNRMAKLDITELFKIHDSICEHRYMSVFCVCKEVSSSERGLKYR